MKKLIPLLILALFTFGFINSEDNLKDKELESLRLELANLKSQKSGLSESSNGELATFLTFQNNDAEEAMNFYVGLFENSKITDVQKHGKDGPAKEGSIFVARFELNGSKFACSDSYIKHEWDFTPGVSIWVSCTSDEEIEKLFAKLSKGGQVMMPLNNYGWSQKFGFVEDRFGVSWQLNLD